MAEEEVKAAMVAKRAGEAAQRILASGKVLELPSLGQDEDLLDRPEKVVLIAGDVLPGASIEGPLCVVVEGSVLGQPQQVCRIDVTGDVVVLGNVRQAEISGNRIVIGKWCSKSALVSERDIEMGGDAVDARLTVGGAGMLKRHVERLARQVDRHKVEASALQQSLRVEQRRTDKLFQVTRISFDFNVGDIVRRKGHHLQIDLEPFYRVVGDKQEEEVDKALKEFFSRAVVGLLTRVNKAYIMENVNNRKIFTTAVRKLHDLIFMARKTDKVAAAASRMENELMDQLDKVRTTRSRVFVGGTLMPEVDMEFVLLRVGQDPEGGVEIGQGAARLRLKKGADGEQRQVVQIHANGEDSVKTVDSKAMVGLVFKVENGSVLWKYAQGLGD